MKIKHVTVVGVMLGTMMLAGCGISNSASTEGHSSQEERQTAEEETRQDDKTDTADAATSEQTAQNVGLVSDDPWHLAYEGETYTWNEITVTIPAAWEGKYLIEEDENGFAIYHKASYEMGEGMGFLCSFVRSSEWMNYGAGEVFLAYTDEGMMYYMVQPTDVTAYLEDEDISGECMQMTDDVPMLGASMQIDAPSVHYDLDEYVIPISAIAPISEDVLLGLSDNELWIARNEIYARHGRTFKNEYLQSYFNSCSWYQQTVDESASEDIVLSEIEKNNLDLIVAAETQFAEDHPYPKEYQVGETVTLDLTGNGGVNRFQYTVTPQGDYDLYDCVLTIDNTEYDLNQYIDMITPVDDVFYVTDLAESYGIPGFDDEDGLEIAVLDYGPSYDLVTYFFKYDGNLQYIGEVSGFPFKEQNNGYCGFVHQRGLWGTLRTDLIETAYLYGYWWYDVEETEIEYMDMGVYPYQSFKPHEAYVDLPVYFQQDENSPARLITAGQQVFFLETDMEEWILVRAKDGTSGYIHVKDGNVLNVDAPADMVFSDLEYFD